MAHTSCCFAFFFFLIFFPSLMSPPASTHVLVRVNSVSKIGQTEFVILIYHHFIVTLVHLINVLIQEMVIQYIMIVVKLTWLLIMTS